MPDPEARTIRVAVAEDHYLVREGVVRLLELEPDLQVVAAVGTAEELLAVLAREPVEVVLTDIRMPPGHHTEGIEAAHAIRARHPGVGVVVLSAHADEAYARDLFRDGTDGLAYLVKDRVGDREELCRSIRVTAAGGSVVDPIVVDAMLRRTPARSRIDGLTDREREVLQLMAGGASNAAIASQLFLSLSAVEKHITSIFAKLRLGEEPATHRRVAAVLAFLGGPRS